MENNYTSCHETLPDSFLSNYVTLAWSSVMIETSLSISDSEESLEEYHSVDRLLESEKLDVVTSAVMRFGVDRYLYAMINEDFGGFDVAAMSRYVQDMIAELHIQKASFSNDVKLFLKKEKLGDVPTAPEEYFTYHWSERFSACMEDNGKVVNLEKDFISTVEKISKILILEKSLPNYLKSIRVANLGGKAGGDKYVIHGILFKFAKDNELTKGKWLYGGTEANDFIAAKSVKNEIQCLRALFPVVKQSIFQIPLMSTYCYLGVTILAMSFLPISNDTLVYGTANGGMTVYDGEGDEILLSGIEELRETFNFAEHPVQDSQGVIKYISLAADVEIHKLNDQYYMLDLARFFPSNDPKNPFSNIFRPDTVTKYKDAKYPISCDCFSGFGKIDSEHFNQVNVDFISIVYAKMVDELNEILLTNEKEISFYNVTQVLHEVGFNLRHMGSLRHFYLNVCGSIPKHTRIFFSTILLREMILRSAKTIFLYHLHKMMDRQVIPIEILSKDKIISLYNEFRLDSGYWYKEELKNMIQNKYGIDGLTTEESNSDYNLLNHFNEREQLDIYEAIPAYARFEGGIVNFKTNILGYVKSFVKEENRDNKITQLVESHLVTEDDLWEMKDYIYNDKNPQLLYRFCSKFFSTTKQEKNFNIILKQIITELPFYYVLFGGEKLSNLFEIIWSCTEVPYHKNVLIVLIALSREKLNINLSCPTIKNYMTSDLMDPIVYNFHQDIVVNRIVHTRTDADYPIEHFLNFMKLFDDHSDYYLFNNLTLNSNEAGILNEDLRKVDHLFTEILPLSLLDLVYTTGAFTNIKELRVNFSLVLDKIILYENIEILNLSANQSVNKELPLDFMYSFPKLTSLDLFSTYPALSEYGFVLPSSITTLKMSSCSLYDYDISERCCTQYLKHLNLSANVNLTDRTLEMISEFAPNLEHLDISFIPFTDNGVYYLTYLKLLTHLIFMSGTRIGLGSFIHFSHMESLTFLNLTGATVKNEHLFQLSKSKSLSTLILNEDSIDKTNISGAKYLSLSVEILNLRETIDILNNPLNKSDNKKLETWKKKAAKSEEEILYKDKFVTLSDKYVYVKTYYVPTGQPKRIPYEKIQFIKTDLDLNLKTRHYKSWGLISNIWWAHDPKRLIVFKAKGDYLIIKTLSKKRIGFSSKNPTEVLTLITSKIQSNTFLDSLSETSQTTQTTSCDTQS